MKDNKNKLTFFENIYYWLWYSMPKPRQYGNEPAPYISFLLALFQILNGGFIIVLLNVAFLNTHYIREIISEILLGEWKWLFIIILISLGFFLIKHDEGYEKKMNVISEKIKNLTPKERRIKIFSFFLYVILSIGLMFFIPWIQDKYY